jgi:integrase
MSKRGENIYKRKDGRWEGRYIKGRKMDGRIHCGYVYGKTYKSTRTSLIEMKYLYQFNNRDELIYSGDVRQWLSHWLNTEIKRRVKISSYASYQYKIDHYILPVLGDCPLASLNSERIQQFIDDMESQYLSVNTIKTVISIFKQGINAAIKLRLLMDDPFINIHLPSLQKNKVNALSLEMQRKVEQSAKENPKGVPILLALYTGMRIGEISALQWSDIDFERELIMVKHTYQRMPLGEGAKKTKLALSKAKSVSSERMIPLGKITREILLNLRNENIESKFVFENNGHPIEPRLLNYHFKKIMVETGLHDIHFHQLRHTFATRCLEAQENIAVISAILGHKSVKTTLDIYTDALTFQKRMMIQKMESNQNKDKILSTKIN